MGTGTLPNDHAEVDNDDDDGGATGATGADTPPYVQADADDDGKATGATGAGDPPNPQAEEAADGDAPDDQRMDNDDGNDALDGDDPVEKNIATLLIFYQHFILFNQPWFRSVNRSRGPT